MVQYEQLSNTELNAKYWNMINRCYSEEYQETNPKYKDCAVCDDWRKDMYKFYDWARNRFYRVDEEQIDLDKDILVKGNKIYSPSTCIFVPHSINVIFSNLTKNPIYHPKNDEYSISMQVEGKNVKIGTFKTETEAKLAYIEHKLAYIQAKAELYKDKIPQELYEAMMSRNIELEDWEQQ